MTIGEEKTIRLPDHCANSVCPRPQGTLRLQRLPPTPSSCSTEWTARPGHFAPCRPPPGNARLQWTAASATPPPAEPTVRAASRPTSGHNRLRQNSEIPPPLCPGPTFRPPGPVERAVPRGFAPARSAPWMMAGRTARTAVAVGPCQGTAGKATPGSPVRPVARSAAKPCSSCSPPIQPLRPSPRPLAQGEPRHRWRLSSCR